MNTNKTPQSETVDAEELARETVKHLTKHFAYSKGQFDYAVGVIKSHFQTATEALQLRIKELEHSSLLDVHSICDQRDKAVQEKEALQQRVEELERQLQSACQSNQLRDDAAYNKDGL